MLGNVYEKRLIEAYISENGTEPTTGEALTVEDLIALKTPHTVYPRPPQMTSIPAMLSFFQNEWDSLALQTYTLQQNLQQTRQELSTALYENDAAVRVIARVTKERDEARAALAQVSVDRGAPASTNGDAMQVDSAPLPEPILEKIDGVQQRYGDSHPRSCRCSQILLVCRRLDGKGQSQRNGLLQSPYRHTRSHRPRSRYVLVGLYLLFTNLATLLLLEAMTELRRCFLCRKTNYRILSRVDLVLLLLDSGRMTERLLQLLQVQ